MEMKIKNRGGLRVSNTLMWVLAVLSGTALGDYLALRGVGQRNERLPGNVQSMDRDGYGDLVKGNAGELGMDREQSLGGKFCG